MVFNGPISTLSITAPAIAILAALALAAVHGPLLLHPRHSSDGILPPRGLDFAQKRIALLWQLAQPSTLADGGICLEQLEQGVRVGRLPASGVHRGNTDVQGHHDWG